MERFFSRNKLCKRNFRKDGSAKCAVDYYRQSFGNYNLTDPQLLKIGAAFSDGKPISVPALYLHVQNDGCIGIENVEGMQYFFSNKFEKHIIRDAGHFIQMEKSEAVTKYILDFVQSLN